MLLIIFMVITPLLQMGYDVKVPPKATVEHAAALARPADRLADRPEPDLPEQGELDAQSLALRLAEILKNRRDKTVFFSGDDAAQLRRGRPGHGHRPHAGAKNIGIVLETVPVEGILAAPAAPAPAPAAAPAQ